MVVLSYRLFINRYGKLIDKLQLDREVIAILFVRTLDEATDTSTYIYDFQYL